MWRRALSRNVELKHDRSSFPFFAMANPSSPYPETAPNGRDMSSLLDRVPLIQNVKVQWKTYSGQVRPWSDFLDYKRVSRPKSTQEAVARVQHNTNHYLFNYVIIALCMLVVVLLNHLVLLGVSLVLLSGFGYIALLTPGQAIRLMGQTLNARQLYIGLSILSLPLLWWASAGDALFWWVLMSGSILAVHASLIEKSVETEFSNEV
jgi:PRA1 family protein 1